MKNINKLFLWSGMLALSCATVSCEDYLDKSPESTVSGEDAYKNFTSFQGFTEELYYCIPDFAKGYWTNSFNWGEDEIIGSGVNFHMGYKIDNGDFWGWQSEHDGWQSGWMDRERDKGFLTTDDSRFTKSLWPAAWYGIRKANMGIENLDKMVDATDEERDIVAGQLYFFRGWFHFQLMQYFGGLPYIDHVLPADQKFTLPRLSYAECATKAAEDFRKAADLLPIDWDKTKIGEQTSGKNQLRINKIMALGYLGKDLLWAGSPLMSKGTSGGTYEYEATFCKQAAEALGELLELVENGQTQYALVDFKDYSNIFYTNGQSWLMPGSTEAIFRGPSYEPNGSNWGLSKQYSPSAIAEGGLGFAPTANYVNYYGMQNGMPLSDAASGFDPSHPWSGRDPRFYHDIVYDGVRCIQGSTSKKSEVYANLFAGGSYREVTKGSRTGYLMWKFVPNTANDDDKGWDYGNANHIHIPWMRLSDIYLMYAESAAKAAGSSSGKYKCSLTALDAVNKIRERAGVEDVNAKFTGSVDLFIDELRRERAVELAYEGHRFNDLRRWLLLDKFPYNVKTSTEFTRIGEINTSDPTQNEVAGFNMDYTQNVLVKRDFNSKHYWLPLKDADVSMYLEFPQNPGW